MTDLPDATLSVPGRLGVSAQLDGDGELRLRLHPYPSVLHHGVVRTSAISFVIDAVAGITLDRDPDFWMLTTDMSVRAVVGPAPESMTAANRVLRQGRRSSTSHVAVTDDSGAPRAVGAVGFARVPRRDGDPPKPDVPPHAAARLFDPSVRLAGPLRDEAGIEVIDAAAGVVQIELRAAVRNPAGTLQGAMVALVAEAAVEEMAASAWRRPAVVADLDLRYLATTAAGPVRSSSRWIGDPARGTVEVELVDVSTGALCTLVYARAVPLDT